MEGWGDYNRVSWLVHRVSRKRNTNHEPRATNIMSNKPIIGITMGDPNGIGAEVIVKALLCSELQNLCKPLVFGDTSILEKAKDVAGVMTEINIVNIANFDITRISPGHTDKQAGQASIAYIKEAAQYALEGGIDAIVTAPISKESIHLAEQSTRVTLKCFRNSQAQKGLQ